MYDDWKTDQSWWLKRCPLVKKMNFDLKDDNVTTTSPIMFKQVDKRYKLSRII